MKTLLTPAKKSNVLSTARPVQKSTPKTKIKTKQTCCKTAAKSHRITITISSQLDGYLRGLLKLGLYGTSISDVAERLICESLHADTKRLRLAALIQDQKQNEAQPFK